MGEWQPGRASHEDPLADDLLRLIFTCCHPALALDSRVALTLRTVAGLSTAEIARAFLVPEATLSQRLLRTKRKIAHAGIPYRVPPPELLAERTGGVLAVLYLIFNEGYSRRDDRLTAEALRLARLLVDLMPDERRGPGAPGARHPPGRAPGHPFRRTRRPGADGGAGPQPVGPPAWSTRVSGTCAGPPAADDRRARTGSRPGSPPATPPPRTPGRPTGPPSSGCTTALLVAQPSPVVALNRAIALGFRDGFDVGLAELAALDVSQLRAYYLVPAARADFLRRLGRNDEARDEYAAALGLVPPDQAEARMLRRRLDELDG